MSSNPSKIPRIEKVRSLMEEYQKLTLTKPTYPRSNKQLAELTSRVEVLRRRRIVHEDIKQPGYVIDESFSGADKYIKFYPRAHKTRFVVADLIEIITNTLPGILLKSPTIKVNAGYNIDMYLATRPEVVKTTNINAKIVIVTRATDLTDLAKDFFARIARNVEMFTSFGSGWVIKTINYIQLSVYQFKPATGSSYQRLPDKIIATRSCINVKNNDDKCALWSLLAALFPAAKNPDRVSNYRKHQHVIDMTGINYPVEISQIPLIEKQNPGLFPAGINVFSFEEHPKDFSLEVFPWLISPASKHVTDLTAVNLLWWNNHYAAIKDLSRLMGSSMSTCKSKMHFCYSCLNGFTTQEKLNEHNKYCFEVESVMTPSEDNNILKFNKFSRTKKLPFVIVGDLESFIKPIDQRGYNYKSHGEIKSSSTARHLPASYRCNTICVNDKYSKLSPIYRWNPRDGISPVVHMLKYLFVEIERIESLLSADQERFTELDSFKFAMTCQRCNTAFTDSNPKVAFYDAVLRRYIGAVHRGCRKFQKYYPVIFHNLRGYDGHFIVAALGNPEISEYCAKNNIQFHCIPNNTERLMSITVGKLRFIDSYQFMAASLDQLARNCDCWPIMRQYFDETELKYVTTKGIFPYEWFDGPRCFDETSLPPQEYFYSSLTDSNITDEDYQRGLTIWDKFSCETFRDYHDLYLTVDVLLLSDIFENFRNTSLEYFGLDPAHYYSTPGLAWDAALKLTKIELELLTDVDMYLFIEKAIRGGISVITKKYSAANNKYLAGYDENAPEKYIIYLDMNNLYGAAMCAPMPYGGFKWISSEEFLAAVSDWRPDMDLSLVKFKPEPDNVGYYVEVDVDYPDYLHDDHNDYPYLPSKVVIVDDMLSREQIALRTTKNTNISKLTPTLLHRRGYVCLYTSLKQALDAGLILRRVHKVLQFNQRAWLKPYIESNTTRRAAAKNDFEKDFFKYMNNAVFGKTMENIRNRVNVELVNKKSRRDKITRSCKFVDSKRITDCLSLTTKRQSRLYLDKPIYVGAAVLDISKTLMYDFHYGFVKQKWPGSQLLFTDTDSLVYEIPGEDCHGDLYQDIYNHRELFDLSDVDVNGSMGRFHDPTNKKVIGKLKDEFSFSPVKEFIGLRSKMYALLTDSGKETKKAKGISSHHVRNKMKFNDYLLALSRTPGVELPKITSYGFRSYRHKVFTDQIIKSGLSNYDDKRICINGVNTYAIGHYQFRQQPSNIDDKKIIMPE